MKYLKFFETENDRSAYEDGESYIEPYVSYVDGGDVHYNKIPETRVVTIFNVTDSSNPTQLYAYYDEEGWEFEWVKGADFFDGIEIDGTEMSIQDLDAVKGSYQLAEGNHTIKYTLKNPTSIVAVNYMGAFDGCSSLTSVKIPNGVTTIEHAFKRCSNLTNVTMPNSLTSIGDYAFQWCSSLTSMKIPSGVTSIGNYAFDGCSSLTSVALSSGVTSIGDNAFRGCKFTSIGEIGSGASIEIPNGVITINIGTFASCNSLTNVTLPSGVTTIGGDVFMNCSHLVSVTLPSGVTSINDYAFCGCSLDTPSREQISAINSRALTCPWD